MARQYQVGKTATTIRTENGTTEVVYHNTPVVRFSEKYIRLNTGGWWTATTKTRMNQVSHQFDLGYSVFQKNRLWFVEYKGETIPFDNWTLTLLR